MSSRRLPSIKHVRHLTSGAPTNDVKRRRSVGRPVGRHGVVFYEAAARSRERLLERTVQGHTTSLLCGVCCADSWIGLVYNSCMHAVADETYHISFLWPETVTSNTYCVRRCAIPRRMLLNPYVAIGGDNLPPRRTFTQLFRNRLEL